jgi:L-fucose isomerase-like protein
MVMHLEKPKVGLVPFGYPYYPHEYLDRFTQESIQTVKNLGLEVFSTKPVIVYDDAQRAINDIKRADTDFIIALILSWLEAPNVIAVLREFSEKPILLWSHTMFKEKGELLTLGPIPGVGVIRETLEEMGFKFKFIWGIPDSENVKKAIISFGKVSNTIHRLSKSKIGLMGYASMGMYTATFDHVSVRKKIGPEIEHLDQYLLIKKIDDVEDKEVEALVDKSKKEWDITDKVTNEDLKKTIKMFLALKKIVEDFRWDAVTVKCQYELSQHYKVTPCVPLSMLANKVTCSCEGDIPLIITQLMMHYLKGETVTYADVHNISINDKTLLLGACGFAPFNMAQGKPKVDKHTAIYMGLLNSTIYNTGKVTLARLASDKNGYKMHIAVGKAMVPEPFHEIGCSPYPSMTVKLDGDPYHFGQHLMSQHYAIVYGDIKKELLELCNLLDIRPVLS